MSTPTTTSPRRSSLPPALHQFAFRTLDPDVYIVGENGDDPKDYGLLTKLDLATTLPKDITLPVDPDDLADDLADEILAVLETYYNTATSDIIQTPDSLLVTPSDKTFTAAEVTTTEAKETTVAEGDRTTRVATQVAPHHPSLHPILSLTYHATGGKSGGPTLSILTPHLFTSTSLHSLLRSSWLQTLSPPAPLPSTPAVHDLTLRFLLLQLLSLLSHIHPSGAAFSLNYKTDPNFSPLHPMVITRTNVGLLVTNLPMLQRTTHASHHHVPDAHASDPRDQSPPHAQSPSPVPPPLHRLSITQKWRIGLLSNYDYLMHVNLSAGRLPHSPHCHPIFPWVTDFTFPIRDPNSLTGSWRDLSRSKFRLNKGDNQLDETYLHSIPPHHITENLSDITYYMYLARRTPLATLKLVVRNDFIPKHYPDTLNRLYEWTPDECIPEFYTDPTIFTSLHKDVGLTDIQVPPFCADADDFISYHRSLLEGDVVSKTLHLWLDLNFGKALQGPDAIRQKNVPLHLNQWPPTNPTDTVCGSDACHDTGTSKNRFVQMFTQKHPQRTHSTTGALLDIKRRDNPNPYHTHPGHPTLGSPQHLRSLSCVTDDSVDDELLQFRAAETRHAIVRASFSPLNAPTPPNAASPCPSTDADDDVSDPPHIYEQVSAQDNIMALPNPILTQSLKIASHTLPSINLTHQQTSVITETFTDLASDVTASYFGNVCPTLSDLHPTPSPHASYTTAQLQRMDLQCVGAVATEMYFAAGLTPNAVVQHAIDMLNNDTTVAAPDLLNMLMESTAGGCVESLLESPFRHLFTADLNNAYVLLLQLSQLSPPDLVKKLVRPDTVDDFKSLSFPAFQLLLPCIMTMYSLTTAAQPYPSADSLSTVTGLVCDKLGAPLASKIVIPKILQLLEDLCDKGENSATEFLNKVLLSDLLPMLYHKTSGDAYIPSMVAFLIGILQHPQHDAKGVEEAAVICLVGLTLQENLGPALSARYIVPALTRLIGNPRFHAHELLNSETSFVPITDMHATQALTAILPQITEEAIGPMICERLFHDQLPTLQQELFKPQETKSNASSLIECIFVLHSALPYLSPEMIYYQYLTKPPLPLHQLLLILLGQMSTGDEGWDSENLFFISLTETTSLLSSVCCCVRAAHVEDVILPAADMFFGAVHDHYSSELSHFSIQLATLESELKVTLSIKEMTEKHREISLQVLALAGMETARELYHTIVEICGKEVVTEKCVSANMLIKWFAASSPAPDLTDEQLSPPPSASTSTSYSDKTLFIPNALGWIKKRVKNLSHQRESEVRRQSVDSFSEPQVKLTLSNQPSQPSQSNQPQPIQRDNSGIMIHHDDGDEEDEEMVMEDPLGVGGEISALIGMTQENGIESINFVTTASNPEASRTTTISSAKSVHANHDSMAELVMEDYIDGAVELQPTSALAEQRASASSEEEDEVLSTRVSQVRIIDGADDEEESGSDSENENGATPRKAVALTPPSGINTKPKVNPQLHANNHPHNQESRRVDRTWLLGSNFINSTPTPWKKIGTPWSTHMVLLSSLRSGQEKSNPEPIRALATNAPESILCSGGRNGEVLVWNLRSHPPEPVHAFTGHRISAPSGYYKPDSHELYDEGDLKTGEILQLSLLDQGNRGVVCDGNLHVWDVETNQPLANLKRSSNVFNQHYAMGHDSEKLNWFGRMDGVGGGEEGKAGGKAGGAGGDGGGRGWGGSTIFKQSMYAHAMSENDPIVAFKALPVGGHVAADGFCSSSESLKIGQQLVAVSSSRLLHIDLREGAGREHEMSLLTMPSTAVLRNHCEACFGIGTVVPKRLCSRHKAASGVLNVASSWVGGEREGEGSNCCVATCSEGNWICVGDSAGWVVCFERRAGRVMHKWKAHEDSVVQLYVVNMNQVFTVSKDKTAILWDLRGIDKPQRMSGISELPMRGPGLGLNSVELRQFQRKEAGKVSNVLYCVSGHKCAAAAIPGAGEGDIKVKHRNFCDPAGQKVQKKKLCSRSMLLLPLRSLMILGCEDGELRACV